jgi:hypothetical protein
MSVRHLKLPFFELDINKSLVCVVSFHALYKMTTTKIIIVGLID